MKITDGPFDIASWDIAGIRAGLPIQELIGTAADRRAVQVSSKFLNMREVYAAVGDTVGPDFPLMADPAAAYSFEKAMQVGRVLESLDHRRFEEPFYEYDIQSDIRLRQKPDIPIAGTETIAARRHSA